MNVSDTALRDVKLITSDRYGDDRGWFGEVFNAQGYEAQGLPTVFMQDNQSFSKRGVLRGLHYQLGQPQGKLVRVLSGCIWDVAVDIRPGSPDFGKWLGLELSGEDLRSLWIPEGFAHGFLVLSDTATVLYKTTRLYHPAGERCIRWDDASIGIEWPLAGLKSPVLSPKDAAGTPLIQAELPEAYGA